MTRTVLLAALLFPGVALAQVSVNSGALDRLSPSAPAAHKAPARPAAHAPARKPAHPVRPTPAPATRPAPSSRASKLQPGLPPNVAPAPPAGLALAPLVTGPAHPVSQPSPVPAVPAATGAVSPIKSGIRITFGAGNSDMNADTEAAVRSFADTVKGDANADLNIFAFAAGVPDDPSTPRRISLSRALAIRAMLIGQGIVSTRIYPRALGASPSPIGGDGPPDRVDLVAATPNSATP